MIEKILNILKNNIKKEIRIDFDRRLFLFHITRNMNLWPYHTFTGGNNSNIIVSYFYIPEYNSFKHLVPEFPRSFLTEKIFIIESILERIIYK